MRYLIFDIRRSTRIPNDEVRAGTGESLETGGDLIVEGYRMNFISTGYRRIDLTTRALFKTFPKAVDHAGCS